MKNDLLAYEKLVERNRDDLYTFALRMTRSETEAAEVAQESFLSAYLHQSHFGNEAEFRSWVHWIAAKHLSIRRQPPRRSPAADGAHTAAESHRALSHNRGTDWNRGADEQPLSAELRRAIVDATDRLPQRHREAFLFKDVAGLSYEQIAEISGQSIQAIKDQLHQARLSLRATIDRFYSVTRSEQ